MVPGGTWVEGRQLSGSSLSFPTTVVSGSPDASLWFGPNLLLREVAE